MKLLVWALSFLIPCAVAAEVTHVEVDAKPAVAAGLVIPESARAKYVDLPSQCFHQQKFPCAVQTLSRGELNWGDVVLQATTNSKLLFLGPELLQVVGGKLWLRGLSTHNVKFGELFFKAEGDLLVNRQDDRFDLHCLKGQVQVAGPLQQNSLVPAGFQNWYRGLDAEAGLEQGLIRASDPKAFIAAWLEIVGGGHSRFQALLKSYRDDQKNAVGQSGQLYRDVIELRHIASKSVDKAREEALKLQQQDREKYRKMFRERFFSQEEPES